MNGEEKEVNLPVSLRDYFAGQVLMSITNGVIKQGDNEKVAAQLAYNFADAMLSERNK